MRRSAFGQGKVDHVEVARHDGLRKDRLCFQRDLRSEVPVGEVCQREERDVRARGDLGGLGRRLMKGFRGPVALLVRERGLRDEDVRPPGRLDDLLRRRGVTGDRDLASGTRFAEDFLRRDRSSVREGDRDSAL